MNRVEEGKMGNAWGSDQVAIAIVVRDLDKAVEHYESCGIGPFGPESTTDTSTYRDYRIYGKTPSSPYKCRARITRLSNAAPIMLSLFEPLEGGHLHDEFLEKHGEGVEHIAYMVDDLDKETAKLAAKGIPVVISATRESGTRYAYFDTRKVGNLYLELIQMSEEERLHVTGKMTEEP